MKTQKNIFIASLLVFSISFLSNAQIVKSIGIKGGASIANQTWEVRNAEKTLQEKIIGIYSALSFELFNSKVFSFVNDIGFCQKGSVTDENYFNAPVSITLNYLEYNALVKARIEKKHFIIYALGGLRSDFRLSVKSTTGYKGTDVSVVLMNSNNIENYGQLDIYGFTIGWGAEYKIGRFDINGEFQYHHDFNYVLNIQNSSYYNSDMQIKNSAFIISVGVRYLLKKKENQQENGNENKD